MAQTDHTTQPKFDEAGEPPPLVTLEANLNRVIVGQQNLVKLLITTLVARGHVLLEDVPGTGKTVLVKALARSLDATFRRIQFTGDLLPNDITGVTIYDQPNARFVFHPGPIFANLVLADEINRASPRTQSAMLEAMAEQQVTSDQGTLPLPSPHFVVATQNPLEISGTYPLPQAQLDRFWLVLEMDKLATPDIVDMLRAREHVEPLESLRPVTTVQDLVKLQGWCADVTVAESLSHYIAALSDSLHQHPDVIVPPSPRALLHLQRLAQAAALVSGRSYVLPDDVKLLAKPALAHRITVRQRGPSAAEIVADAMEKTPLAVG